MNDDLRCDDDGDGVDSAALRADLTSILRQHASPDAIEQYTKAAEYFLAEYKDRAGAQVYSHRDAREAMNRIARHYEAVADLLAEARATDFPPVPDEGPEEQFTRKRAAKWRAEARRVRGASGPPAHSDENRFLGWLALMYQRAFGCQPSYARHGLFARTLDVIFHCAGIETRPGEARLKRVLTQAGIHDD